MPRWDADDERRYLARRLSRRELRRVATPRGPRLRAHPGRALRVRGAAHRGPTPRPSWWTCARPRGRAAGSGRALRRQHRPRRGCRGGRGGPGRGRSIPRVPEDRTRVVEAIAQADELATALPSVAFYRSDAPWSPHRLIGEALRRRTRAQPLIVFCAENHRGAAGLLEAAVLDDVDRADRAVVASRARFVDTVIGKMSGVIDDPAEIAALGLATVTPALPQAFLVEEFDRILVSRVDPAVGPARSTRASRCSARSMTWRPSRPPSSWVTTPRTPWPVSWGCCWASKRVADLERVPGAMGFLRTAFVDESGAVLVGPATPAPTRSSARPGLRGLRRRPPGAHGEPVPRRHHRTGLARPAPQARLGRPARGPPAARPRRGRADASLRHGRGRRAGAPAGARMPRRGRR